MVSGVAGESAVARTVQHKKENDWSCIRALPQFAGFIYTILLYTSFQRSVALCASLQTIRAWETLTLFKSVRF